MAMVIYHVQETPGDIYSFWQYQQSYGFDFIWINFQAFWG